MCWCVGIPAAEKERLQKSPPTNDQGESKLTTQRDLERLIVLRYVILLPPRSSNDRPLLRTWPRPNQIAWPSNWVIDQPPRGCASLPIPVAFRGATAIGDVLCRTNPLPPPRDRSWYPMAPPRCPFSWLLKGAQPSGQGFKRRFIQTSLAKAELLVGGIDLVQ